MTIAEAWDILDAADQIARAHGFQSKPTIGRGTLHISLLRGTTFRHVAISEQQLEACPDTAAVKALVEREVAQALAGHAVTA